jgi:L-seryl-tRNA(Ser) seleniumtransferase
MAIKGQSERLLPALQNALGTHYTVAAEAMSSQIGSGALPVDQLPSHGLVIRAGNAANGGKRHGRALDKLEKALRQLPRPVIGRIADDALWLDCRCLEQHDEALFSAQLQGLSI